MPATVGCPKCQFDYSAGAAECPRCGVVFEKYFRQQNSVTAEPIQPASGALHPIFGSWKLLVRVIGSVVVIAVAYGRPWLNSGRNEAEQHQSAPELAAVADEHGFVQLPSPEG